jgi:hypothetical protein
MPNTLLIFSPAVFNIDDLEQPIPDTTLGIHPCHTVAISGAIKELNYDGGWFYNIILYNIILVYNILKILFGSLSIMLSGSQY